MYTHVFKEYQADYDDSRLYFDDIFFAGSCDDNERIYILSYDHHSIYGINKEEYESIFYAINSLFNDFEYVEEHTDEYTYKQAMQENGLVYNPTLCSKLKKLYKKEYSSFDIFSFDIVAEYLTITTGKSWSILTLNGYYQGDTCTIIYCEDEHKTEHIETYGNMFLGCYRAFYLVDLDENGEEQEETKVYGFYVADNQAYKDDDIKKVLCDYGYKPEETKVLLIDYSTMHTYTKYSYEYTEV